MGRSLRPVTERWGEPSTYVCSELDTEAAAELVRDVAQALLGEDVSTRVVLYDDVFVVWIEDGAAFLQAFAAMANRHELFQEPEFLEKIGWDRMGDEEAYWLSDVAGTAKRWHSMIDPQDGSLRLYFDC